MKEGEKKTHTRLCGPCALVSCSLPFFIPMANEEIWGCSSNWGPLVWHLQSRLGRTFCRRSSCLKSTSHVHKLDQMEAKGNSVQEYRSTSQRPSSRFLHARTSRLRPLFFISVQLNLPGGDQCPAPWPSPACARGRRSPRRP